MFFVFGLAACAVLLLVLGRALGSVPAAAGAGVLVLGAYLLVGNKWMVARDRRLPVLTYHSISAKPDWLDDEDMSVSPETFEGEMRYLSEKGYRTVSLEEVLAHVEGSRPLEGNEVALAFDDGFLDNWVAVYPVLKKYGFQGTIFVPTDFVDGRDAIRPTLEDLEAGRAGAEDLEWRGYVTWRELQEMEKSGVLKVESHGKTHSWLPCADEPADFYRPGDRRTWMTWNAHPDKKPTWFLDEAEADAELMGRPVFPSARSHRVRKAFLPNPDVEYRLNRFVRERGGADFFKRPDWREELAREMKSSGLKTGRWESDAEAARRVEAEFSGSKRILENRLHKTVRFFCGPGDELEPWLEETALRAGYQATSNRTGLNRSGEKTRRIGRTYAPCCHPALGMDRLNVASFVLTIKLFEGKFYYYFPFCVLSLAIKILNRIHGARQCR